LKGYSPRPLGVNETSRCGRAGRRVDKPAGSIPRDGEYRGPGSKLEERRKAAVCSLVQELFEKLSGPGPHGRSSSGDGISKELLHAWAVGHVASRKIRQSFKSESLNDRTAIIEVALQCFPGAPALRSRKRKARDHERKMPAQLDLLRSSEQTKELGFVAVQEPGFLC
jgi:hypothetical protein